MSIKDTRVKRRGRVAEVYELTSDNVTKPDIDVSKPKSKSNPSYYQIKKLIGQYPEFGMTYEKDGFVTHFYYWVTMSEELEERATKLEDPLCDEHHCADINEVWGRMQRMVEFGKEHYPTIAN